MRLFEAIPQFRDTLLFGLAHRGRAKIEPLEEYLEIETVWQLPARRETEDWWYTWEEMRIWGAIAPIGERERLESKR